MTSFDLVVNGQRGGTLVASGHSGGQGSEGGLYSFDGRRMEQIDPLGSVGLFATSDRLFRLLWSSQGPTEVLTYDRDGVRRLDRLDCVTGPHDVAFDGREMIVVSSGSNSLCWVGPDGDVTRCWHLPGDRDSCHLNCLLIHEGELYACAFARSERYRAWAANPQGDTGVVIHVASNTDVLTGLASPHHPRFFDGAWAVCNSGLGELLQINPGDRSVTRRVPLKGWTRGIALTDEYLFVGVTAHRKLADSGSHARIAVLSRRTWEVLDWLPLPCKAVYDLVLIGPDLLGGVRQGFRAIPVRPAGLSLAA